MWLLIYKFSKFQKIFQKTLVNSRIPFSGDVLYAGLQIRNANSHDCEKLRSEANSLRFASHKIDSTSLRFRFAFASQFLKRVRFRFAFAIGTDCEFAEQNLRKSHCFQNIFQGFYGGYFNEVLF